MGEEQKCKELSAQTPRLSSAEREAMGGTKCPGCVAGVIIRNGGCNRMVCANSKERTIKYAGPLAVQGITFLDAEGWEIKSFKGTPGLNGGDKIISVNGEVPTYRNLKAWKREDHFEGTLKVICRYNGTESHHGAN